MKISKKIISVFAAITLAAALPAQTFADSSVTASSSKRTLTITDEAGFAEFAKACRIDSYSEGLYVTLGSDIELLGEYTPISIFGGTFDGNGHTISGVNITSDGSYSGLFRYISRGGLVKNLTVKGNISPAGSAENVGGIAGSNSGSITACSFEGTVKGETNIGGIVGINENSGLVANSSVFGAISGSHAVGGIAGTNSGTILNSKSRMSVNTTATEAKLSIKDIDWDSLMSSEEPSSMTDVGGIAGYSDGIVRGCENFGTVGYPHIGYNIGGIIGRQCGFISVCVNNGEIFGRKDVGGIVGQMEPYRSIDFDKDSVEKLLDELDVLSGLVDNLINDAENAGDAVNSKVQNLTWQMEKLRKSADDISNRTEELYNGWTSGINEISSRVDEALDGVTPALEGFRDGLDLLSRFSESLEKVFDGIDASSGDIKDAINSGKEGLDIIDGAVKKISAALDDIAEAADEIADGMGDTERVQAAVKNIIKALDSINSEVKNISDAFTKIGNACDKLKDFVEGEDFDKLSDGLINLGESMQEVTSALSKMSSALEKISGAVDADELQQGLNEYASASEELGKAAEHAAAALKEASATIPDNDKVKDELSAASDNIKAAGEHVSAAADHINKAVDADQLNEGLKEMETAANELSKALGEAETAIKEVTDALKNISSSDVPKEVYDEISAQLEVINKSIASISASCDDINKALNEITSQIDAGKVKDGVESISDAAKKLSDAADSISSANDSFDKAADSLSSAVDKLSGVSEAASEATKYLTQACDVFSDAFDKLSQTTKNLGDKPKVEFPAADEEFTAAVNSFSGDFAGITNAISSISSTAESEGDVLLEDLRQINEEFGEITDILRELKDKTLNTEEKDGVTTDVSEDNSNSRQGKAYSCENNGGVEGDLNVGGITGSMAIDFDFDPEDDIASEGERSYSFSYNVRDVIENCTNTGKITAKKNYCGGIVGKQDLGAVRGCIENGKVASTSGSYAGGIAGYSVSAIRNCISKVTISAADYVGGIAGQGLILTDNAAILDVYDCNERCGSVAGFVDFTDKNADVHGNSFVDRGIAGIDGISYSGIASPVDFEQFRKLAGSAAVIDVTFVVDGKVIDTAAVEYGGALQKSDFPEIPAKSGCFAEWSDFDSECITFPVTVEAVYTPYITVIESSEKSENGFGLVLADGLFGNDAVISVNTESSSVFAPEGSELRIITIDCAIPDGAVSGLRFLVPEDSGNPSVMQFINGAWKEVEFTENGHYLIVNNPVLENGTASYCVCLNTLDLVPILIIGGCALIAIINIILWTIIIKHKRAEKKAAKSAEKSEEKSEETTLTK